MVSSTGVPLLEGGAGMFAASAPVATKAARRQVLRRLDFMEISPEETGP
jgi:hypothetical protein